MGKNAPFHDTTTKIPADSNKAGTVDDHDDGLIQPFHSFVLSFTMILFSEVGDKTFLVAALMAMKHDRMVVFTAAFGALLIMTVLSAVLGHAVPTLIPKRATSFLAAGLFFVFGSKLMREGLQMDPNEGVSAEMHEVEQELAEKEKEMGRKRGSSVSDYTLEMGLNGSGRRSRPANRLASPARSPSQSPVRATSGPGALNSMVQGTSNLCSLLLSPAWVQTFIMTFLGEWGDRSQIATIAMAAGQDYWWVTLGAMCGHAICTGVAVIGGRAIAGKVSLKVGKLFSLDDALRNMLANKNSYCRRCRCLPCIWCHLSPRGALQLNALVGAIFIFNRIRTCPGFKVNSVTIAVYSL